MKFYAAIFSLCMLTAHIIATPYLKWTEKKSGKQFSVPYTLYKYNVPLNFSWKDSEGDPDRPKILTGLQRIYSSIMKEGNINLTHLEHYKDNEPLTGTTFEVDIRSDDDCISGNRTITTQLDLKDKKVAAIVREFLYQLLAPMLYKNKKDRTPTRQVANITEFITYIRFLEK